MPALPEHLAFRCILLIPLRHGNGEVTRMQMDCCVNSSQKRLILQRYRMRNSP